MFHVKIRYKYRMQVTFQNHFNHTWADVIEFFSNRKMSKRYREIK